MSYYDISYSKKRSIYDFLEKEFLNADKETLSLITNYYYKRYGYGAGNYLVNTYYKWKSGYVGISSLTFGRIIECMPKFLSEEKRFFILKDEIYTFLEKKKENFNKEFNGCVKPEEINKCFVDLQKLLWNFGKEDLQWFIGQNIFSEAQVEHYLNICRYVLNEKILQAHVLVQEDLHLIKTKLSNFNEPINNARYFVSFLNISIFVKNITKVNLEFSKLASLKLNIEDSLKKFGENYFLDELMKLSFLEKSNSANSLIKSNDIDILFSNFTKIKKSSTEQILMNSKFDGEVGILFISLEFVPPAISKKIIKESSIKLVSFISLSILLIMIITLFIDYWIILSIGSTIIWYYSIYPFIIKESNNIKLAKNQIEKYG